VSIADAFKAPVGWIHFGGCAGGVQALWGIQECLPHAQGENISF
jgi:hypothetical protein